MELIEGSSVDVANGVDGVKCVIPTDFCLLNVMAGFVLMVRYGSGVSGCRHDGDVTMNST